MRKNIIVFILLIFISANFIGCGGNGDYNTNIIFDPNKIFRLEDPNMYKPGYELYFHGSTNNQYYPSADVRIKTKEIIYNTLPIEIVVKLWSVDPINVSNLRFSFITYFDPNKRPIKKTEINEHNNPITFYSQDAVFTPLNAKIGDTGILTSWILPKYNESIIIRTDWRLEPTNDINLAKMITSVTRYKLVKSETIIKIDQYGDPKSYKYIEFNSNGNLVISGNRCDKIDIQWDL